MEGFSRLGYLVILPAFSIVASTLIVSHLLKIRWKEYFPFHVVCIVTSLLIFSPLLAAPFFGVIGALYLYLPLTNQYSTLLWWFKAYFKGAKMSQIMMANYLMVTWLLFQSIITPILLSKPFNLPREKSTWFHLASLTLSIILSLIGVLTMHAFGRF